MRIGMVLVFALAIAAHVRGYGLMIIVSPAIQALQSVIDLCLQTMR